MKRFISGRRSRRSERFRHAAYAKSRSETLQVKNQDHDHEQAVEVTAARASTHTSSPNVLIAIEVDQVKEETQLLLERPEKATSRLRRVHTELKDAYP